MCHLLTGVELMTTQRMLCATESIATAFLSFTEGTDNKPMLLYSALLTHNRRQGQIKSLHSKKVITVTGWTPAERNELVH